MGLASPLLGTASLMLRAIPASSTREPPASEAHTLLLSYDTFPSVHIWGFTETANKMPHFQKAAPSLYLLIWGICVPSFCKLLLSKWPAE